jgi:hypothetical protein
LEKYVASHTGISLTTQNEFLIMEIFVGAILRLLLWEEKEQL